MNTPTREDYLSRTRKAFGNDLIRELSRYRFCIIGCGAVGSLFAEMLVRSGAKHLYLIDGDHIEKSNLNRYLLLMPCDVGVDVDKKKVDLFKERLENFGSDIKIQALAYDLREPDHTDKKAVEAKNMIMSSDIVILAADDNRARVWAEDLCEFGEIPQLSIGIEIGENGTAIFECALDAKTPKHQKEATGYGNGSYASIVMEATAAGFGMLLAKLFSPDTTDFVYLRRDYENYRPTKQYFKPENPEG